jgi:predicted DNA repair protein MutK
MKIHCHICSAKQKTIYYGGAFLCSDCVEKLYEKLVKVRREYQEKAMIGLRW